MNEIPVLFGYTNSWSVKTGDVIQFMVSSEADRYTAQIVRVTGRGPRPEGQGGPLSYEPLECDCNGTYPGSVVQTLSGSYAIVDGVHGPGPDGLTFAAWIYPTLPAAGRRQTIMSRRDLDRGSGLALELTEDGRLSAWYGQSGATPGEIASAVPLAERRWYFVAISADTRSTTVRLLQYLSSPEAGLQDTVTASVKVSGALMLETSGPLMVGATSTGPESPSAMCSVAHGSYNGKIDDPFVINRPVMAEDLVAIATGEVQSITDQQNVAFPRAGRRAGTAYSDTARLVNSPMERMTGHNWDGRVLDWRLAPQEYGAVWFHDDDLDDARWPVAFEWHVPDALRSGMYAALLTSSVGEEVVPFYVRPGLGAPRADLAVLVPTFSYTAYSNFYHSNREPWGSSQGKEVREFLGAHREFGFALYCAHRDGAGISHITWRRPMFDQRPEHRVPTRGNAGRELSGDLYLFDWLEHEGVAYDTITDADLHHEGVDLIESYKCVVSGGHPEYSSEAMLDSLAEYMQSGGNFMYLGGNGFYFVVTLDEDNPHVIELRRGRGHGQNIWTGEPGENHHTYSGEPGGRWMDRGRDPQKLFGVGFCAQGGGPATGYVRMKDSEDPRADFIFRGIRRDETIGDFGLKQGGAAGDEVDRADFARGTPAGTLVLATSTGFDDTYPLLIVEDDAMEDRRETLRMPEVRADMTYFENPAGGSCFSVGSIDWSASLSHADYNNNVSRITKNVIEGFLRRPTPVTTEANKKAGD
jgi:N,N-dimethylformamidase